MLVFFYCATRSLSYMKVSGRFQLFFLLLTGQLVAARLGNFVYFDVARL